MSRARIATLVAAACNAARRRETTYPGPLGAGLSVHSGPCRSLIRDHSEQSRYILCRPPVKLPTSETATAACPPTMHSASSGPRQPAPTGGGQVPDGRNRLEV